MKIEEIITLLKNKNLKLAIAESCTGGLIASLITEISGASEVFECGFVTYSNYSKTNLLGVEEQLITQHGAVSDEVAIAMAKGAIQKTGADIAVSVTGIAGPNGGTQQKPVGLVYIAVAIAAPSLSNTVIPNASFSSEQCEMLEKISDVVSSKKVSLDTIVRWYEKQEVMINCTKNIFTGNRSEIRSQSVEFALQMLYDVATKIN